jgi:cytoplasmic iron level regulating protein YaaA (DUF328/UPF0246 family)
VSAPLLLLPPSEGKTDGGRAPAARTKAGPFAEGLAPARDEVRRALGRALRGADDATAARLLGVRGDLLARARATTAAYVHGDAPVLPAVRRYSGVVWDHLGPLRAAEARRVLVPSALYGLTTGADPIADYRLKFSVSLPGIGGLARFWRPTLTGALVAHARRRVVVDLLPTEHAGAFDQVALHRALTVVRVQFRTADGSGVAGHDAKAVKGCVAHAVLADGLDALGTFRWQGWHTRVTDAGVDVLAPA